MPASDLIDLGQSLCLLRNPHVTSTEAIYSNIRDLRRLPNRSACHAHTSPPVRWQASRLLPR